MSLKRQRIRILLASIVAAGVALCSLSASHAAEGASKARRASDRVAKEKNRDAELEKKLDQILANQALILQKFDAVMEELRIIKVRATIRSGS